MLFVLSGDYETSSQLETGDYGSVGSDGKNVEYAILRSQSLIVPLFLGDYY